MEYNFREIENKWRGFWAENKTFKVTEDLTKPKFYVLDMFPYPSGAGLHVGHPLGYIASDIYARYKRLQGFNVLHPMGYDSFGLPAEQYAIQTGQHPALTTEENIARYRDQLDKIGFSYDWDREVRTSSPEYYKWTQWIFKQLFDCYYDNTTNKAERISNLVSIFEANGNSEVNACSDCETIFSAAEWKAFDKRKKEEILQEYRLAYLADSWVNWCPALGTVLANDEVVNGVSERGGHPVEQKLMRQWSMRIKAYAERLITGLDTVDWTESIKDQQRNWIGKSQGCSLFFPLWRGIEGEDNADLTIEVFTTRPDTVYGVSFMVLAPEHPFVDQITTAEYAEGVANYKKEASLKSERDRQADVKNITGQFTGAYAIHPFNGEKVQIWIGDYVLASYGTGAVMAVPCGDQRDYDFAKHFNLEINNIFADVDISEAAYTEKDAVIANSDFLNGLDAKSAIKKAIEVIEAKGLGKGKTNYRLRDAVFSRQRYWGEPFPVYYKNELPYLVDDVNLPIELPEVDKYLPTEDGEPPLARAEKSAWNFSQGDRMEYNTMPGWAGSSWYFLRYMDPKNEQAFVSKEKADYWKQVDLYIGGSEHATGHLLYSRFWTKFLFDQGYIGFDEPFAKMINQGMILGRSSFVYRIPTQTFAFTSGEDNRELLSIDGIPNVFISSDKVKVIKEFQESNKLDISLELKYDRIIEELNQVFAKITQRLNPENEFKGNVEFFGESPLLQQIHVDISLVDNDKLDIEGFKLWRSEYANAEFICEENGDYICGSEVEKMSKSKYNVQTPDELVEKFGADTLRMYEMFLGPLEQSKPWDTKGINGVHNFLRKLWRLFNIDESGKANVSTEQPSKEALKTLHRTIKKMSDDLDRYSFNTGVSNFMICVNELSDQKCNNKHILQDVIIMLSPYAPHICEELWVKLGNKAGEINFATFPKFDEAMLVEANISYPVSFNGKMRLKIELPTAFGPKEVEEAVLANADAQKYLDGNTPKKVIVVPGKIVNIVM
jgi:leucyl-tRNA synthetase